MSDVDDTNVVATAAPLASACESAAKLLPLKRQTDKCRPESSTVTRSRATGTAA